MPLRAFGDVRFKWSLELQQSILASLESGGDLDSLNLYHYTPLNYLTPPYLDVTPEIIFHKPRPQDRFLILGSDGLWDELGSEEAVRLVGEHLSGIHLQVCVWNVLFLLVRSHQHTSKKAVVMFSSCALQVNPVKMASDSPLVLPGSSFFSREKAETGSDA